MPTQGLAHGQTTIHSSSPQALKDCKNGEFLYIVEFPVEEERMMMNVLLHCFNCKVMLFMSLKLLLIFTRMKGTDEEDKFESVWTGEGLVNLFYADGASSFVSLPRT
ncbi:hypothetical protein Y1Q_0000601 [Alligator mississippiensis]|uniref:Uncharacterized protein n=1 Tax=Alligator mississippiensis TaxID=8496 RepID=A0A151MBP1_ALLMI|nr:hypothetical protein Y1Q_0000601 [Alligator mississippiensis]